MGGKSPQEPPPSDAETAEYMRKLAELFVEHAREDGYSFDWDPAFIHHLDNYCTEFAASKPSSEVTHSVIMAAGAYLGARGPLGRGGVSRHVRCVSGRREKGPDFRGRRKSDPSVERRVNAG
ncbi:MAG: hypothetical protein IRZ07_26395 [Microbispora sp.]|nr:hypothetical protein [Microbispora sp.]